VGKNRRHLTCVSFETASKRIAELESTVEHLQDANRRLLRWRFGPRTEKSTEMDERPLRLELEGLSSDLVFDTRMLEKHLRSFPCAK
jgi:hypothetical protein